MKKMTVKLTVVCITMVFAGLFLCQQNSFAKIDPATIVGIWLLDSDSGGVAKDSSANGYDGQIKGAKLVDGEFGKALNFASGDTVSIALGKGSITNKVTFILWLNFSDLAGQQNYLSIYDQSSNRYVPYKTSANELHFWSNNWDVASTVFVSAKTWYHVANVYDGTKVSIYVNGDLAISQASAAFALADQQDSAWLATDSGGWISSRIEDDVGLFNVPLAEEDIKSIMNNGIMKAAIGGAAVTAQSKLPSLWGELKSQSR